MGEFTVKIEGGKLLRLKADSSEEKISFVSIEGDFFAYPESIVEDVEKTLVLLDANHDVDFFSNKIEEVLNKKNATLVGVTGADIANALKEALK